MKHYIIGLCLLLGACAGQNAAQTVATIDQSVKLACAEAQTAVATNAPLLKGGAANTLSTYNSYIQAACATEAAMAAVANNPTTAAWLGGMTANVNALPTPPAVKS